MFTALAAFAEAFGNPIAPALVLCLALVLARPWHLRLAAAGLGCVAALPDLHRTATTPELALTVLGAVLALVLYAELMLHLVMPGLHFAWRCVLATWELAGLLVGALLGRQRRLPTAAPEAKPPQERP